MSPFELGVVMRVVSAAYRAGGTARISNCCEEAGIPAGFFRGAILPKAIEEGALLESDGVVSVQKHFVWREVVRSAGTRKIDVTAKQVAGDTGIPEDLIAGPITDEMKDAQLLVRKWPYIVPHGSAMVRVGIHGSQSDERAEWPSDKPIPRRLLSLQERVALDIIDESPGIRLRRKGRGAPGLLDELNDYRDAESLVITLLDHGNIRYDIGGRFWPQGDAIHYEGVPCRSSTAKEVLADIDSVTCPDCAEELGCDIRPCAVFDSRAVHFDVDGSPRCGVKAPRNSIRLSKDPSRVNCSNCLRRMGQWKRSR